MCLTQAISLRSWQHEVVTLGIFNLYPGITGKDPKTGLITDEQVNICYLSLRMHFLRQWKRVLYILMPEAPYSRVAWLSLWLSYEYALELTDSLLY